MDIQDWCGLATYLRMFIMFNVAIRTLKISPFYGVIQELSKVLETSTYNYLGKMISCLLYAYLWDLFLFIFFSINMKHYVTYNYIIDTRIHIWTVKLAGNRFHPGSVSTSLLEDRMLREWSLDSHQSRCGSPNQRAITKYLPDNQLGSLGRHCAKRLFRVLFEFAFKPFAATVTQCITHHRRWNRRVLKVSAENTSKDLYQYAIRVHLSDCMSVCLWVRLYVRLSVTLRRAFGWVKWVFWVGFSRSHGPQGAFISERRTYGQKKRGEQKKSGLYLQWTVYPSSERSVIIGVEWCVPRWQTNARHGIKSIVACHLPRNPEGLCQEPLQRAQWSQLWSSHISAVDASGYGGITKLSCRAGGQSHSSAGNTTTSTLRPLCGGADLPKADHGVINEAPFLCCCRIQQIEDSVRVGDVCGSKRVASL